ncbi:DUF4097 family beta strand repeat-containing protein [Streptacidiphilus sp. P02-A3a]|uniref:DUF4097 family beta strand repeat-containing protein n=1 Tax=Streptacidiphilus sp. P02-A3a TaxID=2704468 RepID=UPI0015FAF3FB|nr:DUF4097 family beta strand repeat-containing protein [Streptacidiphilus sp. P02-A3a]QMU71492.1 DUF4097 domain-containing protein [Streptacidiphilus sp. P02-A3a]
MQKFQTPAAIRTVLDVAAGRIQVIAADRADTTVEVRPADPARSRDVRAAERTTVEFTDGVLRIRTAEPGNQYFGPSGALEVTVQLPAGSRVEARSATAEFRGVGRLGDVLVEGAYRQIKIDETAALQLTAVDGSVEVGRLGGPARITTARGDIRITEATHGTVVLKTQSGDVTIGAAPGTSASLDAGTGHGRIHNALMNTEGANPALAIHATTGHGDITARSL